MAHDAVWIHGRTHISVSRASALAAFSSAFSRASPSDLGGGVLIAWGASADAFHISSAVRLGLKGISVPLLLLNDDPLDILSLRITLDCLIEIA